MKQMAADVDVVIIGAGAAGIAAARRLAASHLSAIVLEATGRVGGRAWTCEVAGMRLDLGCGWLHSADRNPWTRIAEGAGSPSEEGRDAVRPSQAHPAPYPLAPQGSQRSERRIPPGRHRPKPEATGPTKADE